MLDKMIRNAFVILFASCSLGMAAQDSASLGQTPTRKLIEPIVVSYTIKDVNIDNYRMATPWLSSENAAGLVNIPLYNITYAEVLFNKNDGKLINYYGSDNSYRLGAVTESYFRLNSSVKLYGKVDYSNFRGLHAGGSAFIKPEYNTIDIIEVDDNNRGTKRLETYHLIGGAGVALGKGFALGGKVDYKAANYAKFKDLRHKNDLFDIRASIGGMYKLNDKLDFGLAYIFRRSVESLSFKSYGNTDTQFTSLVSFGAFYGRTELFGDNGYTEKNAVNPMVNTFNGLAAQANFKAGKFSCFNEFSYHFRDGYFGKHSTTTAVFTEHNGSLIHYKGIVIFDGNKLWHNLVIDFSHESLDNFENIYRKETTQGGRTEVVYFGNNKVLHRSDIAVKAYYTAQRFFESRWAFGLGGDLRQRKQTVSLYPYYRKQSVNQWIVKANVERSFWFSFFKELKVTFAASYGSGSGTAKNDGVYATPSTSEKPPKESELNLMREFEYLTAQHISGKLGCRYACPLPAIKGLYNIYIRADYQTDRALNGMFKNKHYDGIDVGVGFNW